MRRLNHIEDSRGFGRRGAIFPDRGAPERLRAWAARLHAAALVLLLCACAPLRDGNFSQFPGWAEWRAANPPRTLPASDSERVLLERFRPRFFLPPGHAGMVDFYRDYVGAGSLVTGAGERVEPVTREALNRHKSDPRAVFTHRMPMTPVAGKPAVYARLDEAVVDFSPAAPRRYAFLSYHAVFRHSGLPAGLGGVRAFALSLVANLDDWHQLDHYTAATVVLDEARCPVALMVQQHNYRRTYVLGESIALPADGRISVDVAIRSNELYPHFRGRTQHRAVNFLSPEKHRYMMGFGEEPMDAAADITEGANEADYALEYLPPSDAFYVFQGFLGERRRLPGRDSPPGADYNTTPAMKPLALQLAGGYWRDGNRQDLARLDAAAQTAGDSSGSPEGNLLAFARLQLPILGDSIRRARGGACAVSR